MSMSDWAKKEIEIAIKREKDNAPDDEWDYGVACYESAYKAFKSLMEDGHSGMSIGITQNILNRLIEGKPLTPITEDDFTSDDKTGPLCMRCSRMSSLSKHIDIYGNVTYSDSERVVAVDLETGSVWSSGELTRRFNQLYPITMPYMPSNHGFKVYIATMLIGLDRYNDYNTFYVSHYIKPDGSRVDVHRIYTMDCLGWREISYDKLKELMIFKKFIPKCVSEHYEERK